MNPQAHGAQVVVAVALTCKSQSCAVQYATCATRDHANTGAMSERRPVSPPQRTCMARAFAFVMQRDARGAPPIG